VAPWIASAVVNAAKVAEVVSTMSMAEQGIIGVGTVGTTVLAVEEAAPTSGAIVRQELNIGVHAAERMVLRDVTEDMVQATLDKGTPYIDPKNGAVSYVLRGGMASGKDLLVGRNPLTGKITTVIPGWNLVRPRFKPIYQLSLDNPILLGPGD
jgi:hypothetical protein